MIDHKFGKDQSVVSPTPSAFERPTPWPATSISGKAITFASATRVPEQQRCSSRFPQPTRPLPPRGAAAPHDEAHHLPRRAPRPPSTPSTCPEIQLFSGARKNATARACSWASPMRLRGCISMDALREDSLPVMRAVIGVLVCAQRRGMGVKHPYGKIGFRSREGQGVEAGRWTPQANEEQSGKKWCLDCAPAPERRS